MYMVASKCRIYIWKKTSDEAVFQAHFFSHIEASSMYVQNELNTRKTYIGIKIEQN